MSEDKVESFEITDYDLGIWADDSNQDELFARPSFKTFNKDPKNYMVPVNFVADGIQQMGKSKEKEDQVMKKMKNICRR